MFETQTRFFRAAFKARESPSASIDVHGGSAEEILARLEGMVVAWTGGRPPDNDVTFVAVRIG